MSREAHPARADSRARAAGGEGASGGAARAGGVPAPDRLGGLRLRHYDARTDVEPMFAAYSDPAEQALFAHREQINSVQEFDAWMTENVASVYHDLYVIEAPANDDGRDASVDGARGGSRFAGFVYSYDYRTSDLRCNMCLYLARPYRGTGAAGIVAATFLDELFSYYPLRKVYLYVYDYNRASLSSDLQAGFVEEGCLREYRYLDGRWWDCHVLAMTRRGFEERLARFSALRHDMTASVAPSVKTPGTRATSGGNAR
ncbi:GNAT family N-acetyltransferase [bacterium]|nr:GNAT family N-acetyltransferase [bacterium]